jgi:transcriptional regulator with XRE-family HTH domain
MANLEFENLSKFLKDKRTKMKLTQASLAAKLNGVHIQFVSNWERGLCAPPGHCFDNLINVLKVNRSELIAVMLLDQERVIKNFVYKKTA